MILGREKSTIDTHFPGRVFIKEGYVYAECITQNGVEKCRQTGFYKFPFYYRRKTKTDSLEENQSSEKED